MSTSAFGPLRELGETQLQIQFSLFSAYDARALGVLAIDGALAAVATAAAHSIGAIWWLSLIGLLASGLTSVSAMKIGGEEKALDIETAFEDTDALGLDAMNRLLAISIADAIARNAGILRTRRTLTSVAVLQTGLTIFSAFACPILL